MQTTMFDLMTDEEQEIYKPKESTDWKWTFADYPKEKNGLKVFSCFACGGGSTMGYKLAGCEVLGCCEIDPKMNEIYVANHHPKYNYLMDIREFNKLEDLPEELYNLDILDGSPPCTTFSTAGLREESWGVEKKFREGQAAQTLDDLSFVFIETVRKLRPKVVIMENVEGLLLGEAWGYVKRIYENLEAAGYEVNHWLLKGEYMGVPQTRHRVFFIATRDDVNINPRNIDLSFNYKPITYRQIISGDGVPINQETQTYKMLQIAQQLEKCIGDVLERIGENRRCFNDKIVWHDDVMPTVRASFSCYRGEEKTKVSIDDIIHAQTFPEDYNFNPRNYSQVGYICGMSVPPIMIKRIVTRLIEQGVFDG